MERENFIKAVSDMADQVWDFHERWNFWPFEGPERSAAQSITERQPILDEEIRELAEAVADDDSVEVAAEAADVLFVALGHVLSLRKEGISGVAAVTAKNAAKTEKTHRIRPDTGKLLPIHGKPHKWE
jgi:NTP pyrophosphatase (non-canonical NTP hydrolase)